MPRFEINETVVIIGKGAPLYPTTSGAVIGIKTDPFRSMLDEYTLRFHNGSTATLFEFELAEDPAKFPSTNATVTTDTLEKKTNPQTRGPASTRQLVLETANIDIHIKLVESTLRRSLIGQVLEKGTAQFIPNIHVRLMQDNTPIDSTVTDALGEFTFDNISKGNVTLEFVLRSKRWRIVGSFAA